MELTRIDEDNSLYVFRNDAGHMSSIGFDYAFEQAMMVSKWLGGNCASVRFWNKGTREGFEEYNEVLLAGRQRSQSIGKRCEAELDQRFTRFYESGERVQVNWKDGFEDFSGYGARTDGMKARFYVGKSTGWMPIYLMIYRRNSHGGGSICSSAIKSLRGLGIFNRR